MTRRELPMLERIRAALPLKLALSAGLYLTVLGPYAFLQRHGLREAVAAPSLPCDGWIGGGSWTVLPYLSGFLLAGLPAYLVTSRPVIVRFALGCLAIGLVANGIFAAWPTYCPRPPEATASLLFRWLQSIDRPLNALPSLHAAFAVHAAAFAAEARLAAWAWMAAWALLICYSAVATHQHTVADVLAGAVLGLTGYRFITRGALATDPSRTIPASAGVSV